MAPKALSHGRRWARALALLVPLGFLGAILASGACVKSGFSLGQSCLTDEDCFSGYCAQQICVAAPPLLDAEAKGDAPSQPMPDSGPKDASGDVPVDGDASRGDAVGDAPRDVGSDNASEGAADVAAEAAPDAPADVASETAADARADVRLDAADGG